MTTSPSYDAIIVGGGHNGLVAAAYLAKAGQKVLLLERLDTTGGAAVSAEAFPGVDARLSRYSYLVSLLPQRIIDDLRLDITLVRRRYSSYTPLPGSSTGLLIDTADAAATDASFSAIGAAEDAAAFTEFYADTTRLAGALWPTLTEPLLTRSEAKALVAAATSDGTSAGNDASDSTGGNAIWADVFERPLGEAIERRIGNDLVRGVVLTDALIGTFAQAHSEDLSQNRCFLYHVIGGGTGDWDVPVGGMGAVSGALWHAAKEAGAHIVTNAEVTSVNPDGTVQFELDEQIFEVSAERILANVAPWVLEGLLGSAGHAPDEADALPKPEGAQVKVNLLLKRLPRLLDSSVEPAQAFGGTFHVNELNSQLDAAYLEAAAGSIPTTLPVEIYCHSLNDASILSPELQAAGAQTLTVFGLHTPDSLVTEENNDELRAALQAAVLASLNSVLAEPIEDCLMLDADGNPCIETKTTLDLEHALWMPGGNIFHGLLSWPFAEDLEPLDTPARRWGVATAHPRILLCGSGSRRGGAVSGLGGHSAAMAVLEELSEAPAS
jgi:phytoene dehydrogenase-like protein